MGVASPHAYRLRRRLKPIAHKGQPLTFTLWNGNRGNNTSNKKSWLFKVRQKAKKLFWGCSLCCLLVFVLCFSRCSSFALLVRCGFLLVRALRAVRAVRAVCRSVGVAFLFLVCLPSVRRGSSGLSVLPLLLAVRASSVGCGCGSLPPAPNGTTNLLTSYAC